MTFYGKWLLNSLSALNLEFDSVTKGNTNTPSTWTPLHFCKKKIYVSGGTLELEYDNTVTTTTSGTPTWALKKARVYIPSPAGNVGTAELDVNATSAGSHKYLVYHYDHLGSIQAITPWGESSQNYWTLYANDATGKESVYSYDAWGQRRDAKDWSGYAWNGSSTAPVYTWGRDDPTTATTNEDDLIPRGFTGHEMMDNLGLINMNGRIYDPRLGRFISADQLVQAPMNAQSYNRYTYCFNNPLGLVDPSGYTADDEDKKKQLADGVKSKVESCVRGKLIAGMGIAAYITGGAERISGTVSAIGQMAYNAVMSGTRSSEGKKESAATETAAAGDSAAPATRDERTNATDAPVTENTPEVHPRNSAPSDDSGKKNGDLTIRRRISISHEITSNDANVPSDKAIAHFMSKWAVFVVGVFDGSSLPEDLYLDVFEKSNKNSFEDNVDIITDASASQFGYIFVTIKVEEFHDGKWKTVRRPMNDVKLLPFPGCRPEDELPGSRQESPFQWLKPEENFRKVENNIRTYYEKKFHATE